MCQNPIDNLLSCLSATKPKKTKPQLFLEVLPIQVNILPLTHLLDGIYMKLLYEKIKKWHNVDNFMSFNPMVPSQKSRCLLGHCLLLQSHSVEPCQLGLLDVLLLTISISTTTILIEIPTHLEGYTLQTDLPLSLLRPLYSLSRS